MNQKRASTLLMWTLAIIVPGGLALVALWLSMRAAQRAAGSGGLAEKEIRNFGLSAVDTRPNARQARASSWLAIARRMASR